MCRYSRHVLKQKTFFITTNFFFLAIAILWTLLSEYFQECLKIKRGLWLRVINIKVAPRHKCRQRRTFSSSFRQINFSNPYNGKFANICHKIKGVPHLQVMKNFLSSVTSLFSLHASKFGNSTQSWKSIIDIENAQ